MVPLGQFTDNCPQFYQNFENYVRHKWVNDEVYNKFRELLKEYNCRYYNGDGLVEIPGHYPDGIIFESAEDATAFILRWS